MGGISIPTEEIVATEIEKWKSEATYKNLFENGSKMAEGIHIRWLKFAANIH